MGMSVLAAGFWVKFYRTVLCLWIGINLVTKSSNWTTKLKFVTLAGLFSKDILMFMDMNAFAYLWFKRGIVTNLELRLEITWAAFWGRNLPIYSDLGKGF